MPRALDRACRVLGCTHPQPCPDHGRKAWASITTVPVPRIAGRRLQRLRQQLFARQPLCVVCEAKGYITRATIRDHIIPLAEGGADTDDNVQALCDGCSSEKTRHESQRGARRAR